jgi:hypothetical protein
VSTIDSSHSVLCVARHWALLDLARPSFCHAIVPISDEQPTQMRLLEEQYMATPIMGRPRCRSPHNSKYRRPVHSAHVVDVQPQRSRTIPVFRYDSQDLDLFKITR